MLTVTVKHDGNDIHPDNEDFGAQNLAQMLAENIHYNLLNETNIGVVKSRSDTTGKHSGGDDAHFMLGEERIRIVVQ